MEILPIMATKSYMTPLSDNRVSMLFKFPSFFSQWAVCWLSLGLVTNLECTEHGHLVLPG